MEKNELMKAFAYAELLWSTFKRQKGNEKEIMEIELWFDFLKPYDFNVVMAGMRELAKESDFCNIAKIAKNCKDICDIANNKPAVNDVLNEIERAISYYNARENFQDLSSVAKRVVGSAGKLREWAVMEAEAFNSVIASNLRKAIQVELERVDKVESVGLDKMIEFQNKLGISHTSGYNKE